MLSQRVRTRIIALFAVLICAGIAYFLSSPLSGLDPVAQNTSLPETTEGSKAARTSYFFYMLRDPATNAIPAGIRTRELRHAERLRNDAVFAGKRDPFLWYDAGPHNVGGRTRALVIDLDNGNRLLAGGVSGGLWESTDRGTTWNALETGDESLSVTYITQDPRPGHRNIWYYASGEFIGNSASDVSRAALYFGSGLHKSTDGGRSWSLLPAGRAGDETDFDSPFDFVNRIAVSPTTGTLFVAANAYGIYRSSDGGASFGDIPQGREYPNPVLGGQFDHFWSDVAVNKNGVVLATLSEDGADSRITNNPGVYLSFDDGLSWTNITPGSFPSSHGRSVIAFSASNPALAYIFTTTGFIKNDREDVRLHRFDLDSGTTEDLSDNLIPMSKAGDITTQNGYNMALAIKPDDENFILLGATNVYRSRNGFSSETTDTLDYWIGGYDAVDDDFGNYENHHPDQHLFLFDPSNPDRVWTANDGGIYVTTDISRKNGVIWFDMNGGYKTTQFYTVAIPDEPNDLRIAGGTQDNGTPFLRLDDLSASSRNISIGDGGHLYFGRSFAYVGFQNGSILRLQYNDQGAPTFKEFSFIHPGQASNQLFVTPFVVDPNDEDVMYYPAGAEIWRNNELSEILINQTNNDGIEDGWSILNDLPNLGTRTITAMAVSHSPAHILYIGSSDTQPSNTLPPVVLRLANAVSGSGGAIETFSIPGAPNGSYISDIAINPSNADELLVVLSNYNVIGLYHSLDGGRSFTAVEGNLAGGGDVAGPSLRAASILAAGGGTSYFVGTSTGLYRTSLLEGDRTVWIPEGEAEIGDVVVVDVVSRSSDQMIAVGTHGRGIYVGSPDPDFNPRPDPGSYSLFQNYPNPFASLTRIAYYLPQRSRVNLSVFDIAGRKVTDLVINEEKETGRHDAVFNAATLASGVYLFQLLANPVSGSEASASFSQTRKMMVIK